MSSAALEEFARLSKERDELQRRLQELDAQASAKRPTLDLACNGVGVEDGRGYTFTLPNYVKPPEGGGPKLIFSNSWEQHLSVLNGGFWLDLELRNVGARAAEDAVVDVILGPAKDVALTMPRAPYEIAKASAEKEMDASRHVYVDSIAQLAGARWRVRHRMRLIAPAATEGLIPMFVALDGEPLNVEVKLSERYGAVFSCSFALAVAREGQKIAGIGGR